MKHSRPSYPTDVFLQARQIIDARHIHLTDEDLLARLRSLLERCGKLSGILIDEAEDMPSSSIYMSRFGGLHRAYELIGWSDRRDSSFIEANRELRRRHQDLVQIIVADLRATGAQVDIDDRSDLLTINSRIHGVSHPFKMSGDKSPVPTVATQVRCRPNARHYHCRSIESRESDR